MGQRGWRVRKFLCLFLTLLILSNAAGAAPLSFSEIAPPFAPGTATQAGGCRAETRLLPIVANEYWLGSQGHCPYEHCGEPYSYVRDPSQPPPFSTTDGGATWQRNICANPYNLDTCQGPYEGAGENFGRAFPLLGQDAPSNYGPANPRGGVDVDVRYNALVAGGQWYELMDDDTFLPIAYPPAQGLAKGAMLLVIAQGGAGKRPFSGTLFEPPPTHIGQWTYCWGPLPQEDNCFNYPASSRPEPYDVLMFLNGTSCSFLVKAMYDNGDYIDGRYAPGQRIVVAAFDGYVGDLGGWDVSPLVGYFRAIIVGYGDTIHISCNGIPGDWQSYAHCIVGQVNTVYAIADPTGPLVLDPTPYLPPPNQAPEAPLNPSPADGAAGIPLTATLSWAASDPDGDPVTYTVAFGTLNPPPVVSTSTLTATFSPGPLVAGTTYYWSIVATDGCTTTVGPVWSFTTRTPVQEWRIYLPVLCKPRCSGARCG